MSGENVRAKTAPVGIQRQSILSAYTKKREIIKKNREETKVAQIFLKSPNYRTYEHKSEVNRKSHAGDLCNQTQKQLSSDIKVYTNHKNDHYLYDRMTGSAIPLNEIYPVFKPPDVLSHNRMEVEWRLSLRS